MAIEYANALMEYIKSERYEEIEGNRIRCEKDVRARINRNPGEACEI